MIFVFVICADKVVMIRVRWLLWFSVESETYNIIRLV